jgi:hypothetical protein
MESPREETETGGNSGEYLLILILSFRRKWSALTGSGAPEQDAGLAG